MIHSVDLVQAADAYGGRIEPAVSPDGTKLAYVRHKRGREAGTTEDSRLYVRDLASGALARVAKGRTDTGHVQDGRPKWPAWFGNDFVLFSTQNNTPEDFQRVTMGSALGWDGVSLSATPKIGLLGPNTLEPYRLTDSGSPQPTNFGDPDVKQPQNAAAIASLFEMRVVTQGVSGDEPTNTRVSPALSFREGLQTEEFQGGRTATSESGTWTSDGQAITECHHGAWSPDGAHILCHAHRPLSPGGPEFSPGVERGLRLLYEYEHDAGSGTWTNGQLAVNPLDAGLLAQQLPAMRSAIEDSSVLSFKYGQYCLRRNWIIFTLFAADADTNVIQSRVVVADRSGERFWDVTTMVEDALGLDLGQLSGYTGTCSSSQTPTLWRD